MMILNLTYIDKGYVHQKSVFDKNNGVWDSLVFGETQPLYRKMWFLICLTNFLGSGGKYGRNLFLRNALFLQKRRKPQKIFSNSMSPIPNKQSDG